MEKKAREYQVSVLIPVQIFDNLFEVALESICQQSLMNIEILIGCHNFCRQEINAFKLKNKSDCRIRVFDCSGMANISEILNFLIKRSSAPFICRMDADDISDRKRLEVQLDYLTSNPDVALVGSYIRLIDSLGKEINPCVSRSRKVDLQLHKWESQLFHPTFFGRRKIFESLNGYSENIDRAQDYDFVTRALLANYVIHNVPEVLLSYRVSQAPEQRQKYLNQLIYQFMVYSIFFRNKAWKTNRLTRLVLKHPRYYALLYLNVFSPFSRFLWIKWWKKREII
ncbi:glycosyltransferase [Planktomarina temperata]|nr:glycosyltransferase [Planktomarina temperata]